MNGALLLKMKQQIFIELPYKPLFGRLFQKFYGSGPTCAIDFFTNPQYNPFMSEGQMCPL